MRLTLTLVAYALGGTVSALSAQASAAGTPPAPRTPVSGTPAVDTSRSSMPMYRRTPKSHPGPTEQGDCGGDAWRRFKDPAFSSEKACRSWVSKHGTRSASPARTASAR
jgi:hypothetical protein